MDWKHRLELLRWRAVEEADAEGKLLPVIERAEATRHAATNPDFLAQRNAWLALHASRPAKKLIESMHVPSLKYGAWAGWLLAFVVGYGFAELGSDPHSANLNDPTLQGRLINVLALPLMSLLLWNAAMIVASLVMEWRASATTVGLPKLLRDRVLKHSHQAHELSGIIIERFHARVDPLLAARLTSRARAWLHTGAAILALGTIAGMYAKGWSRDYRAVWESTLLNQHTAAKFLSALYRPASAVLGIEVPVAQMAAMRAGPGQSPVPQPALPWIHLYAVTLFLLVMLPRIALAALSMWRGGQRINLAWSKFDWSMHEARLKSAISGSGLVVDVLSLGWRAGDEPRDRWSTALREQLGALALLQFQLVPADDLEMFAQQWHSHASTTVIVFNAATTPELEVHSAFARDLRTQLLAQNEDCRLLALVDAHSLHERRTRDAVQTRLELWRTLLKGTVQSVLVCGQ